MFKSDALPSFDGLIEQSATVAYSVPYNWGRFAVTQAAHDAYGLQPFASTDGPSELSLAMSGRSASQPAVSVILAAPNELVGNYAASGIDKDSIAVHVRSNRRSTLLGLAAGATRQQLIDQQTSTIASISAKLLGVPFEPANAHELLPHIHGAGGEPIAETIEQQFAIAMVDAVRGAITSGLGNNLNQWQRRRLQGQVIKRAGGFIVATNVIGAGAAVANIETNGVQAWPFALGTYALIATATSLKAARDVSRFPVQPLAQELSSRLAKRVGDDIHNDFCPRVFNARMERDLGSSSDVADD